MLSTQMLPLRASTMLETEPSSAAPRAACVPLLCLRQRSDYRDDVRHRATRLADSPRQVEATGFDLRQVEQMVNQRVHALGRSVQAIDRRDCAGVTRHIATKHRGRQRLSSDTTCARMGAGGAFARFEIRSGPNAALRCRARSVRTNSSVILEIACFTMPAMWRTRPQLPCHRQRRRRWRR